MRFAYLILIVVVAGCASRPYKQTAPATFSGALDVRWMQNDYFLFVPNKDEPFTLNRKDGTSIRPGLMYTDGGSIPRFLWGIEGYSPWGYAPAYIVHDWLFEAHHCGYTPDDRFTFDDSVAVLAEGLKAVMEASPEVRDYFVFDTVVAAIESPIARRLWDGGSCHPPPVEMTLAPGVPPPGDLLMTIRFDRAGHTPPPR